MKGSWMHTKVKVLMNLLKNENGILNGNLYKEIKYEIIKGNFIEIFIPWRILQAINQTGSGSLNYKGVDTLREAMKRVFPEDKPADSSIKIWRKLFLPSSFRVK